MKSTIATTLLLVTVGCGTGFASEHNDRLSPGCGWLPLTKCKTDESRTGIPTGTPTSAARKLADIVAAANQSRKQLPKEKRQYNYFDLRLSCSGPSPLTTFARAFIDASADHLISKENRAVVITLTPAITTAAGGREAFPALPLASLAPKQGDDTTFIENSLCDVPLYKNIRHTRQIEL